MNGPAHFASLNFIAPLSRDRAQRMANRLAINEPAVLVDIGRRWGELLIQVVAQTETGIGVGVDIDELALQRGRALAIAKGLAGRVRFIARLDDAAVTTADVVICCGASHVFGTTAQALAAQYALTEPGGRALFAEAFWDKAAAQGSEAPDGMDDLSELSYLVDQAVAVGFRPLWIETASRDELGHFESGFLADYENWLVTNPEHADTESVRDRRDSHRNRCYATTNTASGSPTSPSGDREPNRPRQVRQPCVSPT
jgi:SAM-dependent methyltransferase